MKMKTLEKRLAVVERGKQNLQMRVLDHIEKRDWSGARRLSVEIGRLCRLRVEIEKENVDELPLFQKGKRL